MLKGHFMEEALAYQESYGKFMLEKTGMNLGGRVIMMKINASHDGEEEQAIDPRELPRFGYRRTPLRTSLQSALSDMGILAGYALVFFLGAFVAFLRYDLR
jgi:hypothetical protein